MSSCRRDAISIRFSCTKNHGNTLSTIEFYMIVATIYMIAVKRIKCSIKHFFPSSSSVYSSSTCKHFYSTNKCILQHSLHVFMLKTRKYNQNEIKQIASSLSWSINESFTLQGMCHSYSSYILLVCCDYKLWSAPRTV